MFLPIPISCEAKESEGSPTRRLELICRACARHARRSLSVRASFCAQKRQLRSSPWRNQSGAFFQEASFSCSSPDKVRNILQDLILINRHVPLHSRFLPDRRPGVCVHHQRHYAHRLDDNWSVPPSLSTISSPYRSHTGISSVFCMSSLLRIGPNNFAFRCAPTATFFTPFIVTCPRSHRSLIFCSPSISTAETTSVRYDLILLFPVSHPSRGIRQTLNLISDRPVKSSSASEKDHTSLQAFPVLGNHLLNVPDELPVGAGYVVEVRAHMDATKGVSPSRAQFHLLS